MDLNAVAQGRVRDLNSTRQLIEVYMKRRELR